MKYDEGYSSNLSKVSEGPCSEVISVVAFIAQLTICLPGTMVRTPSHAEICQTCGRSWPQSRVSHSLQGGINTAQFVSVAFVKPEHINDAAFSLDWAVTGTSEFCAHLYCSIFYTRMLSLNR